MTTWTITADSVPVLDGWGWADYWLITDWMQWHKLVKAKYGLSEANKRFLSAWEKQESDANPVSARTTNENFRTYARENGFFDGLYNTGALALIAKPFGWITDLFTTADHVEGNAASIIDNAGAGLGTSGKIIKYALPVITVGAAMGILYYGYKTFIK